MNLRNQITKLSAAAFFLLAILWQPLHQFEHLAHSAENPNPHSDFTFQNQHETHCNLCDFIFFPTVKSSPQKIETPLEFVSIHSKQEGGYSNHYDSKPQSNKQLRAPPTA